MSETQTSTDTGEAIIADDSGYTVDGAAEALARKWGAEEATPAAGKEPEETQTDDTPAPADDEVSDDDLPFEEEDGPEDPQDQPPTKRRASDDDEVVVSVDGQETTVAVKDLRRLAGQEKALTRKSQEAAAARKAAEETGAVAYGVLEKMYKAAVEKADKYAKIDLWAARDELSADDFKALRDQIEEAGKEKRFFETELSAFIDNTRKARLAHMKEASEAAHRVLSEKLPGWGNEAYNAIRSYAVAEGLDPDAVNSLVDPYAIILLDKARRYDALRAKAKAAAKKVKAAASPVPTTPNRPPRVVKPNAASDAAAKAAARLRNTGSVDDAAALLMARWGSN